MNTIKTIAEELDQLRTLQSLVGTYEQIAAASMQRIRGAVLENRAFSQGLDTIFQEVSTAYREEITKLMQAREITDKSRLSLLRKNGLTIAVFLSANTGLYGDILYRTFRHFLNYVKKHHTSHVLVVGRIGKLLFEEARPNSEFFYEDFPDNTIDAEQLLRILKRLAVYKNVLLFHGEFRSLVTQSATHTAIPAESQLGPGTVSVKYIFEPSLDEILIFFETQIFAALVEQIMQESRLAKLSSRLVLLDRATVNLEAGLKGTSLREQKLRHQMMNKKQLELTTRVIAGTVAYF